jgi:hypothetical protein
MLKTKYIMFVGFCFVSLSLISCASTKFVTGWSHSCTLLCDNASTGLPEEIQRTGKNTDYVAVCKAIETTCNAGRSAACTNTADWTNANEPLYSGCTAVSFGACTEGCAIE